MPGRVDDAPGGGGPDAARQAVLQDDVAAAGLEGLTAAEVEALTRQGRTNAIRSHTSRSFADIVRRNVLTWFNLILGALWILMVTFGSLRDALFGLVIVFNAGIGIAQEMRAKRTLDRLSLVTAPKARVVRDGRLATIGVGEVVLGDTLYVESGDQIVADGDVVWSDGLELDESLLSGESSPVAKSAGLPMSSGSFVVAGRGAHRAAAVGVETRAQRIAEEGRRYSRTRSEVIEGINTFLKAVGLAMIPIGALTVYSGLHLSGTPASRATDIVAALVAMVPDGLVLLSSVAFAAAAIVLARHNVLANELTAVEGLARTDVVCTDKTGTLTEPQPVFGRFEPVDTAGDVQPSAIEIAGGQTAAEALAALGALAANAKAGNATTRAIGEAIPAPDPSEWAVEASVPFSSARKWSAARFANHGTWVLGAPDVLFAEMPSLPASVRSRASELARTGPRVLLLARASADLQAPSDLPPDMAPAGFAVLAEKVRPDAPDTIRFLGEQGITVKVISGDAPQTVSAIASAAGVPGAESCADGRSMPEGDALADVMEITTVFGRVAPEQKSTMVAALQSRGHTVAMTGDGVNDVLALKAADLGIAMGSGAAASRAVAQLVLLDGRFAELPLVMAEGRRVIANAERVANLFITKTMWATVLALVFGLAAAPYPFLPRHITLVGSLTIGIPAFFLALAPNARRYGQGFVRRVTRFALPAGAITSLAVLVTYFTQQTGGVALSEVRTSCSIVLAVMGLGVIATLERPLAGWRLGLVALMGLLMALALVVPVARDFFAFALPPAWALVEAVAVSVVGVGLLFAFARPQR